MRLNKNFIAHDAGSEWLLVPTGGADWSGLVRGNGTFGAILGLLSEENDEGAIAAALCGRYGVREDVAGGDVARVLVELRRIGALDE